MLGLQNARGRQPGKHGELRAFVGPLPASDGGEVVGQFSTLAVGFAAFQVFTVDYVEADARNAPTWNPGPPAGIAEAVPSSSRIVCMPTTWLGLHRPSKTTTLIGWSIGTWHCGKEAVDSVPALPSPALTIKRQGWSFLASSGSTPSVSAVIPSTVTDMWHKVADGVGDRGI